MNIFGYILIVVTLIITVVIGVKQPPMHSRIIIFDSQYEIVDENKTPPVETTTKTEELPTMAADNSLTKVQIVFQEQEQPEVKVEVKKVETPKTETKTKQNKTDVSKTPKTQTTTTQKPTTTKVEQKVPAQTQTQTKPVTQTTTQQTPQVQTTVKTAPTQTVKVLTAQEEEIAWNVWRSNLQNQLMKDTKMPSLPMGTVFKVSFDVDKNGRVTNVQTWSTDSKYTPYAIEFIAPVIKSYQGKSILDFPAGSQRTKTTFTGGWKIAPVSKYSTPANYNDIEKVSK